MKKRPLGKTGISVSEICLGTMTWGEQNTKAEAFEQMDYALSKDVTFWDTAELYPVPPNAKSAHRTEEIIGDYFSERGARDKVVLATKVTGPGFPWIRNAGKVTPDTVTEALEGSLKRLKTDYIDLYQIHWPNWPTYHFARHQVSFAGDNAPRKREELADILTRIDKHVQEGKIRYFGVSDDTAWGVMTFEELSRSRNLTRIASVQNEYSLLCRFFDKDLHEIAVTEQIGLLAWSPLATGILSGKYLDGALPKGSRREYSGDAGFRATENTEKAVKDYIALARKYDLDPCAFAIAFVLSRPFTTAAIIGATNMAQLKTDISAADITLSEEILGEIENIHAKYARYY